MNKYRDLIASVLMMTGLFAQSLVGVVTDVDSQPLEGANIVVVGTDLGGVSDNSGAFKIDVPSGTYDVTASFIGYSSITKSVFRASVERFISIKTGLKPIQITELISELQVKGGTIISPPNGNFSLRRAIHRRFAEEPLLTKTLYLTPNHFDHKSSNSLTLGPEVNLGSFCLRSSITGIKSLLKILFCIKGNFISLQRVHILNDIALE